MEKYTLYVGLNDKDSKMQEISILDAYKTIRNICLKRVDGVTISEAEGVYTHENGTVVIEKTLRVEMLFASKEDVKAIVNEIKTILNQESVAVQFEMVNSELW